MVNTLRKNNWQTFHDKISFYIQNLLCALKNKCALILHFIHIV